MLLIQPPIRNEDLWGKGSYNAPRGDHKHNGIDIACYQGSVIISPNHGIVTKIGYPYPPSDPVKGHLRYVQITEFGKFLCRYFYILPYVKEGDKINPGDKIGISQGLTEIYKGITDHIHYEVKMGKDKYLDPNEYLSGSIPHY